MSKQSAYFAVPDFLSGHDAKEVKRSLAALPGVLSVAVGDNRDAVSVDYDSTGTDAGRIEKALRAFSGGIRLETVDEHLM